MTDKEPMRHDRILHTDAVAYWGDVGVRTPPALIRSWTSTNRVE